MNGVALGLGLILIRSLIGRSRSAQGTRASFAVLSSVMAGMPILSPTVIAMTSDYDRGPYTVSLVATAMALVALPWERTRNGEDPTLAKSTRMHPDTPLSIAALVAVNASVLTAILTLPIANAALGPSMGIHTMLIAATLVWLGATAALSRLRKRSTLRGQLALGAGVLGLAFLLDACSAATGRIGVYLAAQSFVYFGMMLLQATLFARIASVDKLAARAFGTQSALQVALATLIVILTARSEHRFVLLVASQSVLLSMAFVCGRYLMTRRIVDI